MKLDHIIIQGVPPSIDHKPLVPIINSLVGYFKHFEYSSLNNCMSQFCRDAKSWKDITSISIENGGYHLKLLIDNVYNMDIILKEN